MRHPYPNVTARRHRFGRQTGEAPNNPGHAQWLRPGLNAGPRGFLSVTLADTQDSTVAIDGFIWERTDTEAILKQGQAFGCDLCDREGRCEVMQYLWPLSETFYGIAYGWEFDSWQNFAVAITALILCGHIAIRRGYSFAEAFLPRAADVAIVAALRQRFSPQGTRSLGRETRLFGSATLEGTQHHQ